MNCIGKGLMDYSQRTLVSTFIRWFNLFFNGAHDFQLQVAQCHRTAKTCKWSGAEFVNTFENLQVVNKIAS